MLRWAQTQGFRWIPRVATLLFVLAVVAVSYRAAFAIRFFGLGNSPLDLPGWPKAAAAIINNPARVVWWEHGDGGLYGAEFCGDARSLSAALAEFAKVEIKTKRLIVHSGAGHSAGFDPTKEADPAKEKEARRDWTFIVLTPDGWERPRHKMPLRPKAANVRDADSGAAQIDVYTGGTIRWSEVIVPERLTVTDKRLESHGFTLADGLVLEGKVIDLATQQPLAGRMRLDAIEQSKGGNRYTAVAEAATDAQGRWVLKNAPAGWHRVLVEADGYVPRWIGSYSEPGGRPGWQAYNCGRPCRTIHAFST